MNLLGLPKDGLKKVADHLDLYLADLHVLYTKLHNYHWNVEGPQFFALHSKLEELYDFVAEEIDEVAERILMLGHRPSASMKVYLEKARLQEAESVAILGKDLADQLLKDYSIIVKGLREGVEAAADIGDEASADLMIGALAEYEKAMWMLKAFLNR